jgi:hypothetical protein
MAIKQRKQQKNSKRETEERNIREKAIRNGKKERERT